jgi:hypothetical protein
MTELDLPVECGYCLLDEPTEDRRTGMSSDAPSPEVSGTLT